MIPAPFPENEALRLKELEDFGILDTIEDTDFDDITKMASEICNRPIALISLLDTDRQWFKSHHGLAASETPRDYAFCGHAILEPGKVFRVKDSTKDERFFDNPLVTGEPHVISYVGIPLVPDSGLPLGTLCVIGNEPGELSEKQLVALKALANQVLAQLELRRKIRKLQQTQSELQSAFDNLNRYSYSVAHDLKGPLQNIQSLSDIILEDHANQLDGEGKTYLDMLSSQSTKLRNLVIGILHATNVKTVDSTMTRYFSLQDMLNDIIIILSPEKSVEIELPSHDIEIKAYRYGLHIIFQNLIANAIKYNDKEEPVIQVTFEEKDGHYHFQVSDNGPGIAKEFHNKIFNPFQTLGNVDRYKSEGTGIGLSLVRDLVDKMNGRIELESSIGKGAKFTVIVPNS